MTIDEMRAALAGLSDDAIQAIIDRSATAAAMALENLALAAEVERLRAINQRTYCAYCGHEEPIDGDGSRIGEHIRRCERHPMRAVERELADLRAVFDAPRVMLFADGREPTRNERHLANLLEWSRHHAQQVKEDRDARIVKLARICEEMGERQASWLGPLVWVADSPDRDIVIGGSYVRLYAPGGKSARACIWHNATERMLPPNVVYLGTPEREATLAECVAAALELWRKLYEGGEGKDGAK